MEILGIQVRGACHLPGICNSCGCPCTMPISSMDDACFGGDKPLSSRAPSLSLLGSYLGHCGSEVEVVVKISPPGTSCGLLHCLPPDDPELLAVPLGWTSVTVVGGPWSRWAGAGSWPLRLPLSSSSVSICVCLSPTCPSFLRPSVQFSLPCGSQNLPRDKARGTWAWEESGARVRAVGTPEPQVAGTWVPPQLCSALTTCLASFPSAQHWGGRFLGGNREGPYWLVPS